MARRATGGRWPAIRSGERLSCREVGRLLQVYLDRELERPEEAACLAAHLEECRRCGLEADTYRRIKASLAERGDVPPPEAVERLRAFGERLVDEG